jgi:hypothetical protein
MEKQVLVEGVARIEDILGPADSRYFSQGFKNIDFRFEEVKSAGESMSMIVHVEWASQWAAKKNKLVAPHLGTAEFFAISTVASEVLLESAFNLDSLDRSISWVRSFDLKTQPCGESQQRLPVFAEVKKTYPSNYSINSMISEVEINIGPIITRLSIDHPPVCQKREASYSLAPESISQALEQSFMARGYKTHEHKITNVLPDLELQQITASVSTSNIDTKGKFNGLCSGFNPCFHITDFVMVSGQMTQVLLYMMDNLHREDTHNMWLREIHIRYPNPTLNHEIQARISFTENKKLVLKNKLWRSVSLFAEFGGLSADIKVAHQLPE